MGLIVDTSILIAAERSRFAWDAFIERHEAETIAIAAITVSELLVGSHRTTDPVRRARRSAAVERMLSRLFVYPFGASEARQHALIRSSLLEAGAVIGAHDLLIAATAMVQGCGVATLDRADFARVPGLRVAETAPFVKDAP